MKKDQHPASPQLVVALDVSGKQQLEHACNRLPRDVSWAKIGLELFTAIGPESVSIVRNIQKSVFLDLKLHDIPRTVARAVTAACRHEVAMLTVHAVGGPAMLRAAAEAAAEAEHPPLVVAVTALTSLDQDDLAATGIARPLPDHARALAELALDNGIDGVVCSPLEAAAMRKALGPDAILVTPGVRPAGGDVGDQKRVATPADAVRAGSNFLVVGRPIMGADDPAAAARNILAEMQRAP